MYPIERLPEGGYRRRLNHEGPLEIGQGILIKSILGTLARSPEVQAAQEQTSQAVGALVENPDGSFTVPEVPESES